ncbi:MAG: type II secretion system protein GspD, partial [Phycisphaerales bacterium]
KPGAVPVPGTITGATTTSNLAAQLSVSPFSNALFIKGRPEELPYVRQLLALVDVPNRMKAEWYDIGMRAAEIISAMGVREGLGEVTVQEASSDPASPLASSGTRLNQPSTSLQPGGLIGSQQQPSGLAGAGFVIFPEPGGFMYYGTVEQHARVKELIDGNKMLTVGEQIVYKFYKLKNTKAVEVADIISALVNNQQPIGNTGNIIGNDLSRGNSSRSRSSSSRSRGSRTQDPNQANQPGRVSPSGTAGGIGGIEAGEDTFVMPDEKQNQIIVKTRAALQPEFAKLIEKLDARRPQVYIEAQIVAVTDNQNSRLAIETQLFAGQFGLNTNFGLGTLNNFLDRKNVSTSLPALTAAIIQSDKVPFIITALQNNTDGRVLATPQLLVDDNEPATVTSDTIVQTQVTTTIDSQPQVSVGEPVSAGTELTVTPQISENAVKLEVFVRQSAFIGSGTATLPPDQQENIIDTGSVTVPRDATIVIGGLSTENIGKTVVKVPLLGDIPLVGLLFRDTTNTRQRTKLYVFITPRIMRDQNFMDARLLSQGPAREASIQSDFILPAPELLTSPNDMPPAPPAPPAPPGPPTPPAVAPSGSGTPGAGPETSSSGSPIPPPQPIGAEIEKNKP